MGMVILIAGIFLGGVPGAFLGSIICRRQNWAGQVVGFCLGGIAGTIVVIIVFATWATVVGTH